MLKKLAIIFISLLLLGILFSKMFLFQVRYDEVAIVERFQNVKAPYNEAGIKFRLPWPIDHVDRYSKRLQVIPSTMDTQQTKDRRLVIVTCFLVWQIQDPSQFHQSFDGMKDAGEKLTARIREVSAIIGSYKFDQLINVDAEKLKLNEIEKEIHDKLKASFEEGGYGISVEKVGINRIYLPETSTQTIFDQMVSVQEGKAENARKRGESDAVAIRAGTDQARQQILDLAQRVASDIRAEGDRKSAEAYELYAKDQEFAVFLQKIETLKKILDKNTTFVLTPETLSILELLKSESKVDNE